ncbi:hypothetical protein BH10PSE2_BH10PSE2_19370 [soil metagenome]
MAALITLLLAFASHLHAQTAAVPSNGGLQFPALTGRVVDQANLLTPAAEAALDTKLQQLETDTSDQLVVVTLASLQGHEIEDYGYRLGRAWGIGQAGASSQGKNNGVLLIVAPAERKVRIEVGYGLEPILTDALSAQIIQTDILPAFRDEGYTRGIDGGVDAIMTQLRLDPAEAEARAATAAAKPESAGAPIAPIVLVALVFLFIFIGSLRGAGRAGRRRGSGVGQVLSWAALNALGGSSSDSGGGGFGGGGGGFSGGGGSFGGGGASGGW